MFNFYDAKVFLTKNFFFLQKLLILIYVTSTFLIKLIFYS